MLHFVAGKLAAAGLIQGPVHTNGPRHSIMFFKQFSTAHTKPSKKHFLTCNAIPFILHSVWTKSDSYPYTPNGGLLEILLEFLTEVMNLKGNFQRGFKQRESFMGLGRGSIDILFPVLLCSRNGDSSPLNTTIGTLWALLNKLNNNLNQMFLFNLDY